MHKKITLTLLFSFLFAGLSQVQAQSDYREVGTRFASFDNFGIIYKKETAENKLTRYNLAFTSLNLSESSGQTVFSGGLSFGIGWEKRKQISDKLMFIHGFSPSFTFGYANASGAGGSTSSLGINLGYVLGLQYNISDELYFNIETVPGFVSNAAFRPGANVYNFGIRGDSQSAALTLAYRFRKR